MTGGETGAIRRGVRAATTTGLPEGRGRSSHDWLTAARGSWPRITPRTITVPVWRSRRPPSAPFRNGHGAGAHISGGDPGPRCPACAHAEGQRIETGRAHPRRTGPTHGSDGPSIVQPRPPVRAPVSACGGQMRQNEPDRSWATYTRHVNVRSTENEIGQAHPSLALAERAVEGSPSLDARKYETGWACP